MLPKSTFIHFTFLLLGTIETVHGREAWLERKNRPVFLHPRRFGQEQPNVLTKLSSACSGDVCGTLAGQAVTPLLAAQPECSQQDMADAIIDASKQFDAATQANIIALAKEYRQVEKNTPPDFTTNPPSLRNSVFCQKAPKNAELVGLVQAQDPSNDPNLFFDPASKATVKRGTQANTAPFSGSAVQAPVDALSAVATATIVTATVRALPVEAVATECVTALTVTVTGPAPTVTGSNVPTITVGGTAAPTSTPTPTGVDFGSCTTPEIEFAAGFDNRTETSFQPEDKTSFNHDSAQNINIITQFICDTLTNTCKANQAAKDLCATAQSLAAAATPPKTGIQADVFNQVFGIVTNFVDVQPVDDQGRPVGSATATTVSSTAPVSISSSTSIGIPFSTATATATATLSASSVVVVTPPAATIATGNGGASGNAGSFGTCTAPQIVFAQGLDGRRETSFAPADKTSFNHGSAQNISIITQFICDSLTNSCDADATAKSTCALAASAASAAPPGSGAQADAFNKFFGFTTNFSSVAIVDNQGRTVESTNLSTSSPPATNVPTTDSNSTNTNTNATGSNLQTFSGNLGGVVAPTVTDIGNGQFQVAGNASLNNLRNARLRSCDVQNNQCANAANASGNRNGLTVSACTAQQAQCVSNAGN